MTTVKCLQCGLVNDLADEACRRCGAELLESSSGFEPPASAYKPPDHGREQAAGEDSSEVKGEQFRPEYNIGPFSTVMAVVRPTIKLFTNNIWLIARIILVVFAPYEIFRTLSVVGGASGWQLVWGLVFLGLLCKALVAPSLIHALMSVLRTGEAPGLNECYRSGLGRLGILVACAVMAWILEMLGFICLVIPGIILALAFELIYPIASLEELGPVEVLKRSFSLTKGRRGEIFLASLLIGLLSLIVYIPAGLIDSFLLSSNASLWPIDALLALVTDIVKESSTILSLVIYLSIVHHSPPRSATPAHPPAASP